MSETVAKNIDERVVEMMCFAAGLLNGMRSMRADLQQSCPAGIIPASLRPEHTDRMTASW
jgi:hypothetical protein